MHNGVPTARRVHLVGWTKYIFYIVFLNSFNSLSKPQLVCQVQRRLHKNSVIVIRVFYGLHKEIEQQGIIAVENIKKYETHQMAFHAVRQKLRKKLKQK